MQQRQNDISILVKVSAFSSAFVVAASTIQFGIVRDKFIFEIASIFCMAACALLLVCGGRFKLPMLIASPSILLFFFGIGSVVSGIYQQSIVPVMSAVFFVLTMHVVIINSYFAGEKAIHVVVGVSLFLCVFILSISFLIGFSVYRFSGVFDNPNGMGRYASTLLLFLFLYGVFCGRNLPSFLRIFIWTLCFILLLVLLASNSRGSLGALFGAFSGVGVVYLLRFVSDMIIRLKIKKSFIKSLISLAFILVGVLGLVIYSGFHESLVEKFVLVSSAGDFSQGRFGLWRDGINNFNFGGYSDYRSALNMEYDAHNNFIHMVLNFGYMAPLFFVFYFLVLGWHFFVQALISARPISVMGFALFVYLMLYWMVETGSAILSVWLLAILYGCSVSRSKAGLGL